jgi:proline iminopeptidase
MRDLYPEITPYNDFKLPVSDLHSIYVQEVGNPKATPVIFLHGGPGGGCGDDYRRYFDPRKWRIILFDQRGCGKSTPFAELKENTTWNLVDDIEKIRTHLGISKWFVFGGSWGSTLSLSYGISHPEKCLGLILRGIFLLRKKEIQWFYQEGASKLYPDAWEKYLSPIAPSDRHDLVAAYYKILTGDDEQLKIKAARSWSVWEASTSKLTQSEDLMDSFDEDHFAQAFARIECHYFTNNGFFDTDNWILDNVNKISHIPTWIVHGRYDVVCPVESAWDLKKQLPNAKLYIMQNSGHSLSEPEIKDKIIEITDSLGGAI